IAKAAVLVAGAQMSVGLAACGGSTKTTTVVAGASQHIGVSVSIWAVWTWAEQGQFQAVLQPFENQTGITVNYAGKGSNMDTVLEAAVKGGAPPDVALVPDPGTLRTLAQQGSLKPLSPVIGNLASDFGPAWSQ